MNGSGEVAIGTLERVLRRDRLIIIAVLAALTALSWAQMVGPAGAEGAGAHLAPCCGARFDVTFAMWIAMMVGMMIPSLAPMVLTHAAIVRRRAGRARPSRRPGSFSRATCSRGRLQRRGGVRAGGAVPRSSAYRHLLTTGSCTVDAASSRISRTHPQADGRGGDVTDSTHVAWRGRSRH